eukprot:TRINITY_DN28973_c0_g1_i1.p1 TRINITY_DN28973_c0_g1~~TRINITY_DN28973_c0_g1_i1.p1  ORF type:complete len:238 (-),score=19.02 TRINITY_DN28973_c0_g1_i1:50-763(-)
MWNSKDENNKPLLQLEGGPVTPMDKVEREPDTNLTWNDRFAILTLFTLYFLQGLPIGFFSQALPVLLVEKGATYAQFGTLSICLYPFAFKLFWAPILDTYYSEKIGKRKTYILPIQYVLGLLFIWLSYHIETIMDELQIVLLTGLAFGIIFLTASQDIAVDGWVLTSLREDIVGYGSSCQTAGQNVGIFLSANIFIWLNSTKFCNNYIFSEPRDTPLVSLSGFLFFVGVLFLSLIHI